MFKIQENVELFFAFRTFDYQSMIHQVEQSNWKNFATQTQKYQLVIWNTLLAEALCSAEISFVAVQQLFAKHQEKIEGIIKKELQNYPAILFHDYMLVLQQYRRFTNNKHVNDMITFMLVNLHENLTLPDIANVSNITENYAISLFRQYTKFSPIELYYRLKIERAQFLLLHTTDSITNIGSLLQFSDQSHFTKRFKQIVGMTPRHYRQTQNQAPIQLIDLL